MIKRLVGAVALVVLAVGSASYAQDFKTSAQILSPKVAAHAPQYAIAFGKVLARIDKNGGVTKFNYQSGKLVSEVLPSTIIGTYQYDKAGKFQGVFYNDGRKITLSYNRNGSIAGLTTNFRARVQFKTRSASGTQPTTKQAFFAIQNGLSSLIDAGGNDCISDVPTNVQSS